ncbi:PGAP1-like alpha/beta domain-containing protein [Demequina activiva]|uniref:GPI inositol-deacylase PGAP1-like alpha/beta domain-containing protein n=1 Tax=Demequina activiva TaxID=1582364 RepID=A0A919Q0G8_9MICO|nr:hypothetical protein [Demequina activiva]GIG54045.1 hypothetical protein Dac01nite_07970 [Demequina activiva]
MSDPAPPPISVHGGAGGERAVTEDLERAAAVLASAAQELREAAKALRIAQWNAEDAYSRSLPEVAPYVFDARDAAQDASHGPHGALALERELDDVSARLSQVAHGFLAAEQAANHHVSVLERTRRAVRDLALTVAFPSRVVAGAAWSVTPLGTAMRITGDDPVGEALMPDGPPPTTGYLNGDTAGAAIAAHDIPRGPLPSQYEAAVGAATAAADALERLAGEPALVGVHVRPGSGAERASPLGLEDLVDGVAAVPYGEHGAVAIDTLTHADGTRSHIVSIPGTADHTLWDASPFDWLSNGQAVVGRTSDTARLVALALERHGIRATEPVMLVGHSQGGIVAATIAASEAADRLAITHVVTAGSPIDRNAPIDGVEYIHLSSLQETVHQLDGVRTPDAANVISVVADLEQSGDPAVAAAGASVLGAHALGSYAAIGRAADASLRPSLTAWRSGASAFLGSGEMARTEYAPAVTPSRATEPSPGPNAPPSPPRDPRPVPGISPGGIPELRP